MTAEQILDSAVFKGVFKTLEGDLHGEFAAAVPTDTVALERIALRLWGLTQVKLELERQLTKAVETRIN